MPGREAAAAESTELNNALPLIHQKYLRHRLPEAQARFMEIPMGVRIRKVAPPAMLCTMLGVAAVAYAYQSENVANGGSISGVVRFVQPRPKPARLEATKDIDVCGKKALYDQSLLVSKDGGIENAVVTIEDISAGKPFRPEKGVRFAQSGCEYIPHVLVFPAGSTIDILNLDGIMHNIHTESSVNPVIDMVQPGFKKMIPVTIEKPEIIKVGCDVHNWMNGWWYVVANPYYAKTDASGRFTITDVPAGTYKVKLWQEKLGTQTREVAIRSGGASMINFEMEPASNREE